MPLRVNKVNYLCRLLSVGDRLSLQEGKAASEHLFSTRPGRYAWRQDWRNVRNLPRSLRASSAPGVVALTDSGSVRQALMIALHEMLRRITLRHEAVPEAVFEIRNDATLPISFGDQDFWVTRLATVAPDAEDIAQVVVALKNRCATKYDCPRFKNDCNSFLMELRKGSLRLRKKIVQHVYFRISREDWSISA